MRHERGQPFWYDEGSPQNSEIGVTIQLCSIVAPPVCRVHAIRVCAGTNSTGIAHATSPVAGYR